MASLQEMVMAAEHQNASKIASDPIDSGARSFAGGFEKGFGVDQSGIQRALDMVKLQTAIEDMKHKVFSDKVTRQAIKESGMFGNLFDEDIRNGDFNNVGQGDKTAVDMVTTNKSKLMDTVNSNARAFKNRRIQLKSNSRGLTIGFGNEKKKHSVSKNEQFDIELNSRLQQAIDNPNDAENIKNQLQRGYPKKFNNTMSKQFDDIVFKNKEQTLNKDSQFQEGSGLPAYFGKHKAKLNLITRQVIDNDIKTMADLKELVTEDEGGVLDKNIDVKAMLEYYGKTKDEVLNYVEKPDFVSDEDWDAATDEQKQDFLNKLNRR